MGSAFQEQSIDETFDKLANLGVIQYGHASVVPLVDDDFPFEFRICGKWSKKPMTVGAVREEVIQVETFGPGSDINKDHPDQVLGHLNDTHIVALNAFPVFKPQFLLLTLDSYQSQNDPLDAADVAAGWKFLHSVDTPFFAMYNCTSVAGCSRNHKHIQVIPKPESYGEEPTGFCFFPDRQDASVRVPYVHFIHRFDGNEQATTAEQIFEIYQGFLKKTRKALGTDENDTTTQCPHNVVLDKKWLVVIPRRSGNYKSLSVNSAGMLGMPTLSNASQMQLWREVGPANALREFGIPVGEQNGSS